MKRVLLVALALTLGACAPSQTRPAAGAGDPGGATLALTPGEKFQTVRFGAGVQDAVAVRLTLTGVGLAVNDPTCRANGAQIVCEVGTVPAGRFYVLPARSAREVAAEYGRAGGVRYDLTAN